MSDELVFAVEDRAATAARPVTFADAGLREREHLQEWVISNPEILGPGVMIVTFEFDRWTTSAGQNTYERLDVLGLDQNGYLVVAELKRDRAPDSVTMQALNYAAMVSRFSLDALAETLAASPISAASTPEDALALLQEWAPAISDETISAPRIVLIASDFGPTVTNLALYLYENGIDIQLTRVQPYETGDGRHIITVSRILPVPNAEEFMVRPRSGVQARSAPSTVSRASWDWESYATEMHFSSDRIALARTLVEALARQIEARGLPWEMVFRKGYVVFNRSGGYNVVGVDLYWLKPVRVWVKLPSPPDEVPDLDDPYPHLTSVWDANGKQWGWHVDSSDEIADVSPVIDLGQRFQRVFGVDS